MNEENGWRGAAAYRDAHKDALSKHVFALESDRGGFAPRAFESDSNGASLAKLAALCEPLKAFGIESVSHAAEVGVDVSALQQLGVPCAGFSFQPSSQFHSTGSAPITSACMAACRRRSCST